MSTWYLRTIIGLKRFTVTTLISSHRMLHIQHLYCVDLWIWCHTPILSHYCYQWSKLRLLSNRNKSGSLWKLDCRLSTGLSTIKMVMNKTAAYPMLWWDFPEVALKQVKGFFLKVWKIKRYTHIQWASSHRWEMLRVIYVSMKVGVWNT